MILVRDYGLSLSGRENNCCFLNTGQTRFANVSTVSGLDLIDDARGCAVVDWDKDGDLDLWVSNRTGPQARYFRNDVQNSGNFISLKLEGAKSNRDAIGARVTIKFDGDPEIHMQTLRAGEGFLSQSAKRVHFGIGDRKVIDELNVRWPDGSVDHFTDLDSNRFYKIVQGKDCVEQTFDRDSLVAFTPSQIGPLTEKDIRRTVVAPRSAPVELDVVDQAGAEITVKDIVSGPTLVNLWSETCAPCIEELVEFKSARQQLDDANLRVLPIRSLNEREEPDVVLENLRQYSEKLDLGFEAYAATADTMEQLTNAQNLVLQIDQELELPTSFLLDSQGRVSVVYRGKVSPEVVLADAKQLSLDESQWNAIASPFAGKWFQSPFTVDSTR